MPISVFNAEDHPILQKGVTELIQETGDMQWVESANKGRDALDKIRSIQPDISLLGIEIPFLTGIEIARTLIKEKSNTQAVLLTLLYDESFI